MKKLLGILIVLVLFNGCLSLGAQLAITAGDLLLGNVSQYGYHPVSQRDVQKDKENEKGGKGDEPRDNH